MKKFFCFFLTYFLIVFGTIAQVYADSPDNENTISQNGPKIFLLKHTINDSENNEVNVGENFYLNLDITNIGNETSQRLYARIETDDLNVKEILSDYFFVGKIEEGKTIKLKEVFKVQLNKGIEDQTKVSFLIKFFDDHGRNVYESTLFIKVNAPKLNFSVSLLEGNVLESGSTGVLVYTIKNEGHADTSFLHGMLTADQDLGFLNENSDIGIIKRGVERVLLYRVFIPQSIESGSIVTFNLWLGFDHPEYNHSFAVANF